jgi:glycosyltransferase involved in cell wall biosynthesis
MNNNIKLFFCTDGIFPHAVGGMQRHSLLLIKELANYKDLEITVIHPHEGIQLFDEYENVASLCIPTDFNSGNYPNKCYLYSKEVFKIVSKNPDAIIYAQGLTVWYKSNQLSNRLIVNPHGLEPYQTLSIKDKLLGTPFRLIFNSIFRNATKVVSLGGKLTKILEKSVGKEKIVLLPNAVVPVNKAARAFNEKTVRFLFVGRFAFNKGIDVLIDTVEKLQQAENNLKVEFFLVGKGPLYDNFVKSKTFPNLHYMGFADDDQLNSLYQKCDVFILPTLFEGMPTVVLEAMIHSMAVIVTDVGATKVMVDKENGYIVKKNSAGSLKQAILDYCSLDETQKEKMADASYNRVVNNFTWEKVAAKHYKLFKSIHKTLMTYD